MTPSGIEPATFRFVAQHLNHCSTAVPGEQSNVSNNGVFFFVYGATARSGPGPPHYRGFTITLKHTTLGEGSSERVISPT